MTGAGISADSGIQTFRDSDGLWEGHRPEDVATPEAWARDPALVWRFYQERRAQLRKVQPNPAHQALADAERRLRNAGHRMTLITQNVDDLHDRVGSRPIHMHGELASLRCESCTHRVRGLDQVDPETFLPCPRCGDPRLRPDIVWFGEIPFHMEAIQDAVLSCTHFAAIGTSGQVWPAAGMLVGARDKGAPTYVQALVPPANSDPRDTFFAGRAAEVVPPMLDDIVATMLGEPAP